MKLGACSNKRCNWMVSAERICLISSGVSIWLTFRLQTCIPSQARHVAPCFANQWFWVLGRPHAERLQVRRSRRARKPSRLHIRPDLYLACLLGELALLGKIQIARASCACFFPVMIYHMSASFPTHRQ